MSKWIKAGWGSINTDNVAMFNIEKTTRQKDIDGGMTHRIMAYVVGMNEPVQVWRDDSWAGCYTELLRLLNAVDGSIDFLDQ